MQKCKEASEVGIPVFLTEEECQWLCNQMDITFARLPEKSGEATAQEKADLSNSVVIDLKIQYAMVG
jgi:hypothetical protein